MAQNPLHTAVTFTGVVATRRSAHTYTHAMVVAIPLSFALAEMDSSIDSWVRISTEPDTIGAVWNADSKAYAEMKLEQVAPKRRALVARIEAGETHDHAVMSWHSTPQFAARKVASDMVHYTRRHPEFFAYVVVAERS